MILENTEVIKARCKETQTSDISDNIESPLSPTDLDLKIENKEDILVWEFWSFELSWMGLEY